MKQLHPLSPGEAYGHSTHYLPLFHAACRRYSMWLLLFSLIFSTLALQAQAPAKHWDAAFGGNADDFLRKAIPTSDGGYLLAGSSASSVGGDKTVAGRGNSDFWVTKINSSGAKVWDNVYGGIGSDVLTTAIQTSDGGYLLGGTSNSPIGHEKSEMPRGGLDYWVVKISASGALEWDKTIGGDDGDDLGSVVQTADGGFLLGGASSSERSGDKSENSSTPDTGVDHGRNWDDFWVVKIAATGEKIWDKTFGQYYDDHFSTLINTADGGFLVGGINGALYNYDSRERDLDNYSVYKFDSNGTLQWRKDNIGGSGFDSLTDVVQTVDGGYLLAGSSNSPVGGDKTEPPIGEQDYSSDFWLVKLSSTGSIEWDKTIGGDRDDFLQTIKPMPDGGFLLGGQSSSGSGFDKSEGNRCTGDCDEDHMKIDFWLVNVNSAGEVQWDKTLGSGTSDFLTDVALQGAGTYLLAGYTSGGISGDKTMPSRGRSDFRVVQLGPETDRTVSFTLINADTDEDVMEIRPGAFIDYALLRTRNINIRANTNPSVAGSVVFSLNGVESMENLPPYALGKDNYPDIHDYKGITLPLGQHVLTAIPYTGKNETGAMGIPLTVPFTVVDGPTVLSLTLVDASSDQDIMDLKPGDVIDYGVFRSRNSITVRANTYPDTVGSVVFTLNTERVRTENIPPYALGGDMYPSPDMYLNYHPYPLPLGDHTLTATPFTTTGGAGPAGKHLTISFSVVELPVITNIRLINADTDMPADVGLGGIIYYLDDIGTLNVNIEATTYPPTVGSVVFKIDGVRVSTENIPPYAMFGDNYPSEDLFKPGFIPTGPHTLEVTPYTGKNGSGMQGTTSIAQFLLRTCWYCTDDETLSVSNKANATAVEAKLLNAFPNPFRDRLTLQLGSAREQVQVMLVDQLGRTVYQKEYAQPTGAVEVDVSGANLKAGIYFLHLQTASTGTKVLKLMKQ